MSIDIAIADKLREIKCKSDITVFVEQIGNGSKVIISMLDPDDEYKKIIDIVNTKREALKVLNVFLLGAEYGKEWS